MFEHSVPVPRLYKEAAKVLKKVQEKKESLKQCVYGAKHPNLKAIYALVLECVMRHSDLSSIFEQTDILTNNRLDPWLARVLVTELLWGKKQLKSDSKPIQTVLSYQTQLHELALGTSDPKRKTLQKVSRPRYVRVNTLLITVEDCVNAFRDDGWILVRPNQLKSYDDFLTKASALEPDEFMIDMHVKELLLFSHSTQFYRHNAYRNGLIMLQDKASCLSGYFLNPTPGSTVLDMCAAPGMKTTHLAALLNDEGTVYACEMNEKRFGLLNEFVEKSGATCVTTLQKDVLTLKSDECPDVEYILVDPSCSGSGITDRIETDEAKESDPERLKKLSGFQILILRCALTNFKKARRVVYSTCSIYEEENEYVVKEVLKSAKNFELVSAVDKLNLKRDSIDPIGGKCVRMTSEKDLTHGFFIAVFERTDFDEEEQETESGITKAITNIIGEDCLADDGPDGAENEWETRYLNSIEGDDKIRKQRKRYVPEYLSSTTEASKTPITSKPSSSQKEKDSQASLVSSYIVSETQVTRVRRRKVKSLTTMENESSSSSTCSQEKSNPAVTILDEILDQVIIVKKKSKSNKSATSSEKSDLEYQATKKVKKSKDCQFDVKHNKQHHDEEAKQLSGSKKLKLTVDQADEIPNKRNKQEIKNKPLKTQSKIEKPKKKDDKVKAKTNKKDGAVGLPEFLKSSTTKKKNKVNEVSSEPSGKSGKQKSVDGGVKQKLADSVSAKEVPKLKKKTKKRSSSKDSVDTVRSGNKHKSKKVEAKIKADNKRAN